MDQGVRENIIVLWLKVGRFAQKRAVSRTTVGKKQVQINRRQDENCLKLAQQGNLENNSQLLSAFLSDTLLLSFATMAGVSS